MPERCRTFLWGPRILLQGQLQLHVQVSWETQPSRELLWNKPGNHQITSLTRRCNQLWKPNKIQFLNETLYRFSAKTACLYCCTSVVFAFRSLCESLQLMNIINVLVEKRNMVYFMVSGEGRPWSNKQRGNPHLKITFHFVFPATEENFKNTRLTFN